MQGPHVEPCYTLEMLKNIFVRPAVALYYLALGGWLAGHWFWSAAVRPKGDFYRGMSLGMMGGALNGNMYCIKTLIELIKATAAAESIWDVWWDWFPPFVLVFTVSFALSNGFFLTLAMQEFDTMFAVPLYVGTTVTFGCISSTVVLKELNTRPSGCSWVKDCREPELIELDWSNIILYWLCVTIMVGGISGLYQTERNRSDRMAGSSVRSTTAGGKEGLDDTILDDSSNDVSAACSPDADSKMAASNLTLDSTDSDFL
eukprot:SAG31_NODE_5906_length_2263_cov_1.831793_3_plen_259_part_00